MPSSFPYLEPSDDELANSREAAERDVWATGARMEFLQSIRFARQAFEARRGRDGYGSFGSMAAAEAQGLSWTQAAPYFEPMPGWLIPPAQSQAMLNYVETGMAVQTLWTPGVPAAGTLSPVGRALSGGGKARLVLPAANTAVPRGFASAEQFGQASAELRAALQSHGITDATIGVRGSSVTGTSFKTGQPFGPASDIDFFVESAQLTNGLKTSRKIPGLVYPKAVMKTFPELRAWSKSWSSTLGRPATPAGFVPGTVPNHPTIIAPH